MKQEVLLEEAPIPLTDEKVTQDNIFELLMKEEDFTWQTMLYELVRQEKMDPWDIDVSKLSKKFIQIVKKLKTLDFRITGKMVLASAILLKIKSNKLMAEDISAFDALLQSTEEEEYLELEGDSADDIIKLDMEKIKGMLPQIVPRVPQPRKRKVSIFDIVNALEKALDVQTRRTARQVDEKPMKRPEVKHREISLLIKDVYDQIIKECKKSKNKVLFHELLSSDDKESKIFTFIPVLHLTNQRKLDLYQEQHFGDIEIELLKNNVKLPN